MEMTEQQRKDQLTELTGGLRCRCPGFDEMVEVECKGIYGVKYCKFTCKDAEGNLTEYPVGQDWLCQCKLGKKIDPISIRTIEEDGSDWGYARCLDVSEGQDVAKESKISVGTWLPWVAAAGVSVGLWFVLKK